MMCAPCVVATAAARPRAVRDQHATVFESGFLNPHTSCVAFQPAKPRPTVGRAGTPEHHPERECDLHLYLTISPTPRLARKDGPQHPGALRVLVGDELCGSRVPEKWPSSVPPRVAQMYTRLQENTAYLPLGPHGKFWDAFQRLRSNASTTSSHQGKPAADRRYLFNVMAAFTGGRAKHLKRAVDEVKLRSALPPGAEYFVSFSQRSVVNRNDKDSKGMQGFIAPPVRKAYGH